MALFIRSFSKMLIPDRLHQISDRVYVFDCCLSRTEMSESEYKTYMNSVVSSLQRHHEGASYMVFNFSSGHENGQSFLSDILSEHEMTVVEYPLDYENFPLLPLEMIRYFLKSSDSWLSLEDPQNVVLLHCEQGGWHVLAFMVSALVLYRKGYGDEQKTLELVYNKASKEVLSSVNVYVNSQIRYLKYVSDWKCSYDALLMIESLVLMKIPLLDGEGCRPIVMIYGQDPTMKTGKSHGLLFSSLSNGDAIHYYHEEECLVIKLDINRHVQGDVFLECKHLGDDLVTQETMFRVMFHTGFVESNVLTLGLHEIDVVWDAKSKFHEDFKAELHFLAFEEGQEHEESYYESESEFFEVEDFDMYDSDDHYIDRNLPPNYTIEELKDDDENGSDIWAQNSEIMFSVESFKELYLDDDDDDEDEEEGFSDASSVENIVIMDKTEKTNTEADDAYENISVVNYVRIIKTVDSECSEEGNV